MARVTFLDGLNGFFQWQCQSPTVPTGDVTAQPAQPVVRTWGDTANSQYHLRLIHPSDPVTAAILSPFTPEGFEPIAGG